LAQLESDPDYLLALDAGNTRIKWGVHDGGAWRALGAMASSAPDWAAVPATARRAIASNVAGAGVEHALARMCAERGIALTVIRAQREQLGVVNGYGNPHQLGSDRWAALIAARHSARGALLVVNVGTALTVDGLAGDGRFVGGLIVPGPGLMARALESGTAGLRLAPGAFREFPLATPDAIASGAVQACVGAIVRFATAMEAHAMAPAQVLVCGGAAAEIAPHLPMAHSIRDNLVLDGLVLIDRAP
jgi:type III pantothenate kinase